MERVTYRMPCGRSVPARVVRRGEGVALIHYIDRLSPFSLYLRRRMVRAYVSTTTLC